MNPRHLLALAAAAGALAFAAPAEASTEGTVSGTLKFYQFNGGYCEVSTTTPLQPCSGARYQKSAYGTIQPVRDTVIYIINEADGTMLGTGTTDSAGNFTASWFTLSNVSTLQARVQFFGYHKSGSFYLMQNDLVNFHKIKSSVFTVKKDQNVSGINMVIGTSTAGNSIAALYNTLHFAWNYALAPSGKMVSDMNGVRVAAFGPSTQCSGAGSCADSDEKVVRIGSNAAFDFFTPMHELGHIASFVLDGRKSARNYCYPDKTCSGAQDSHSITEDEWLSASFEEGFASIVAGVGMWATNAAEPRLCQGTGKCTGYHLELSFNTATCRNDNFREEGQVTRFLWDLYDTHADTTYTDTRNHGIGTIYDVLDRFTEGTGDHQNNEPWNSGLTALDAYDGRSPGDYLFYATPNLVQTGATSVATVFSANCLTQ